MKALGDFARTAGINTALNVPFASKLRQPPPSPMLSSESHAHSKGGTNSTLAELILSILKVYRSWEQHLTAVPLFAQHSGPLVLMLLPRLRQEPSGAMDGHWSMEHACWKQGS